MAGIGASMDRLRAILEIARMPNEQRSLNQRVALSSFYSVVEFATVAALRIISTVIMTRLLDPSAFGVFAIVMMFLFIFVTFTDLGLRPIALSHEDNLSHDLVQSIWTAQIIRGVVLFAIVLILGLGIGYLQGLDVFPEQSAYNNAELPAMIMVVSFVLISDAFLSPNIFLYEAKIQYERVFLFQIGFAVINLVIMLLSVYLTGTVWGLVWGSLIASVVKSGSAYLIFKGAALRLRLPKEDFLMFINRGKWILGSTFLTSTAGIADQVLFGLFLTDVQFGLYFIAMQIARLTPTFLQTFSRKLGIQIFKQLQQMPLIDFRRKYYNFRLLFDGIALGVCGMLVMVAPLLVDIIYEDRYAEVADFLQILAFSTLVFGPLSLRQAFIAERNFRMATFASFLRMVTIWTGLAVALLVFGSTTMAVWVVALQYLPEAAYYMTVGRKRGWVTIPNELRTAPFIVVGMLVGSGMNYAYYAIVS